MNRISKITAAAVITAVVPVLAFASPAMAVIQSSIESGNIYRVKNVTKNTDFTDPVNAEACDVLEYWVRVHNIGPDSPLTNVTVKAAFPSAVTTTNTSTVTARGDNASPSSTTDTATVNLSTAQALSYQSGSTQLFDANGNFMQNLPDGVTQSGINIGTVGVSTAQKRFVHFKMKINCPEKPTPTPTPTPTPKPAPTPEAETLPNTGAGDVLGIFAGASAFGTAGHYISRRFRRED